MKRQFLLLLIFVILLPSAKNRLMAQDPMLGEIRMVGFNFAPRGWALCDGQLLPISQYTALFSLLGTTYGGDGMSTFGLPDLRGRVPIHAGQGPGLTPYAIGQKGGVEVVTLTPNQLPAHSHAVGINTNPGTSASPANNYLGNSGVFDNEYSTSANSTNTNMIQATGSNAAHENRQPYITVYYIIALQGIYPSRY